MLILRNVNGLGDEQEDREGWNEPEVMQLPVREMPVREGRGQEGASQEGEERISRQEADQPVAGKETPRSISARSAASTRVRIAFIPAPIPSSGSGSARRVARPAARDMTIAGRSRETNEVARATRKPARRTLTIIPARV